MAHATIEGCKSENEEMAHATTEGTGKVVHLRLISLQLYPVHMHSAKAPCCGCTKDATGKAGICTTDTLTKLV